MIKNYWQLSLVLFVPSPPGLMILIHDLRRVLDIAYSFKLIIQLAGKANLGAFISFKALSEAPKERVDFNESARRGSIPDNRHRNVLFIYLDH